jgi:hypothetical protein
MNDSAFDRLLTVALQQANLEDYQAALTEESPVFWSLAYRRQRRRLLADPWSWYRRKIRPLYQQVLQRAAAFLLCALVSLGVLMAASPTVRAAVVRWVRTWYEDHIEYVFRDDGSKPEPSDSRPTWLPEGYRETSDTSSPDITRITYENDRGEKLYFTRVSIVQGDGKQTSTEDMVVKTAAIHGCEAELYLSQNEEKSSKIIWMNKSDGFNYNITGYVSETVLIALAESVQ